VEQSTDADVVYGAVNILMMLLNMSAKQI